LFIHTIALIDVILNYLREINKPVTTLWYFRTIYILNLQRIYEWSVIDPVSAIAKKVIK